MDANRGEQTVLVVADDPDILILAKTFLGGKGYRVLIADDQHGAVGLLGRKDIHVHSVAIRDGMRGSNQVHALSLERKAEPWYFSAFIEDGIVHMKGLEPVAAASDLWGHSSGNAFAAG